jgi:hypothetical protein
MENKMVILEDFGKILIEECYDECFGFPDSLRNKENPPQIVKAFADLFKNFSDEDFDTYKRYQRVNLGAMLFNFLRIFEEHPQFKIYFENGINKIDLNVINDDLKSEPIILNGWIDKHSKYSKF